MRLLATMLALVGLVADSTGSRIAGNPFRASEEKPQVSDETLTSEQVAVYREVLQAYVGKSEGALNLADTT